MTALEHRGGPQPAGPLSLRARPGAVWFQINDMAGFLPWPDSEHGQIKPVLPDKRRREKDQSPVTVIGQCDG